MARFVLQDLTTRPVSSVGGAEMFMGPHFDSLRQDGRALAEHKECSVKLESSEAGEDSCQNLVN